MNAEQLKAERARRTLTQAQMAEFLGVPLSTYIKWESDKSRKKPIPVMAEKKLMENKDLDFSVLSIQEIAELDEIARAQGVKIVDVMGEFLRDGIRRAKEAAAAGLSIVLLMVFCHQIAHPEDGQPRRFGRRRDDAACVEDADTAV